MFSQLVEQIFQVASKDYLSAVDVLIRYIDTVDDFIGILEQIGTIPESIEHDSTEEKLFAKASDAVLARAFREIGLKSAVLSERANSADVQAESPIFGYSVVADAKAFRMSRTAKNQKDFKVVALSGWRKDADYAVLCAPHFHYPKVQSQIYAQSIEYSVCLLSWENLIFMIKYGIRENVYLNLSPVWNYCERLSHTVTAANMKRCFLNDYKNILLSFIGLSEKEYSDLFNRQIYIIEQRGIREKTFWEKERADILEYTKEKAINELLKSKKIDAKLNKIEQFVRGVRYD